MKLSDLTPGDVAVFAGLDDSRFILTHDRRCQYADGSSICVNGATEVRRVGRGRYVPPVPGRIAMDGEPDAGLTWTDASQRVLEGFPDDGRTILVALDPEQCREAGIEYHGEPVAVSCWGHKLKTTAGAIRIHPEMVVQFAGPIPVPAERGEGE